MASFVVPFSVRTEQSECIHTGSQNGSVMVRTVKGSSVNKILDLFLKWTLDFICLNFFLYYTLNINRITKKTFTSK